MILPRVMPTLLLQGEGLVKGTKFKNHKYVGDPINAVKIFNEKEVDELIFLDITATREGRTPSIPLVERLADECFMPFGVGGGIRSVETVRAILGAGAEKVAVNSASMDTPDLITRIAEIFGSQAVVASIDVAKTWTGAYRVATRSGSVRSDRDPVEWACEMEKRGAGEILLNSIDRDGTMSGYDIPLLRSVVDAVSIPVIAAGGAGSVGDLAAAIQQGHAAAVSAGALFVFHGPKRAVLINFPGRKELATLANP